MRLATVVGADFGVAEEPHEGQVREDLAERRPAERCRAVRAPRVAHDQQAKVRRAGLGGASRAAASDDRMPAAFLTSARCPWSRGRAAQRPCRGRLLARHMRPARRPTMPLPSNRASHSLPMTRAF